MTFRNVFGARRHLRDGAGVTEPLLPPEPEDPKGVYVPVAGSGIATTVCPHLILPRGLSPASLASAVT